DSCGWSPAASTAMARRSRSRAMGCWRAPSSTRSTTSTGFIHRPPDQPRHAAQGRARGAVAESRTRRSLDPVRIVFAGTATFAAPTLRHLVEAAHEIPLVVTQPDRPAGRGLKMLDSPIKRRAIEAGLPIFQPERIREPEAIRRITELSP